MEHTKLKESKSNLQRDVRTAEGNLRVSVTRIWQVVRLNVLSRMLKAKSKNGERRRLHHVRKSMKPKHLRRTIIRKIVFLIVSRS